MTRQEAFVASLKYQACIFIPEYFLVLFGLGFVLLDEVIQFLFHSLEGVRHLVSFLDGLHPVVIAFRSSEVNTRHFIESAYM